MLVYREQENPIQPLTRLAELRTRSRSLQTVDEARDLLMELGELECGIADALSPKQDDLLPLTRQLRTASLLAGRAFVAALQGDAERLEQSRSELSSELSDLLENDLPSCVRVRPPEGYAQYSLFPEQYWKSARLLTESFPVDRCLVIGLRSIGTSLSAVVEATLQDCGVSTRSATLRPRGHPFQRELTFSPHLTRSVSAELSAGTWTIVVDEGPGMSGSSLTCVVEHLLKLGARLDKIILVPAHDSDGAHFVNSRARELWLACQRVVAPFDVGWLGRSSDQLSEETNTRWREQVPRELVWPVHPHHGRRRYRTRREADVNVVSRFAGFGPYGRRVLHRAEALAEAGFGPRPYELRNGFLDLEWLSGEPCLRPSSQRPSIAWLAEYYAFRERSFRVEVSSPVEQLHEVLIQNTRACLGDRADAALRALDRATPRLGRPVVVCDARPFPQDFLIDQDRYWKIDALDHGDDHFYPGPVDIAWDLAAVSEELDLGTSDRAYLLDRYAMLSQDRHAAHLMYWYRAVYLAFRAGYCQLAAQSLDDETEKQLFQRALDRYKGKLARLLAVSEPCVA